VFSSGGSGVSGSKRALALACSRFSSSLSRSWLRDFRFRERFSRPVGVRRVSFWVRWVNVWRMGGWVVFKGRPRRDSRCVRRVDRVDSSFVWEGE
jgi:hypothetical protein